MKRIIISIILTTLVCLAAFNLWFQFLPVNFSFDIKSKSIQPFVIETVLNKKDDTSFRKSYREKSEINLLKRPKYNVSFSQKGKFKRLKLIFSKVEPDVEYQISNLSFERGKFPIKDLSKFKSDDAAVSYHKDYLSIIPNKTTITLNYQDKITVRQTIKFDLLIFLTISILSYLLFYKLVSTVKFKINKNISILDCIFILICALLLFIPMFNISKNTYSNEENRCLAEFKPLFNKDNSINLNFGKDYESFIRDKFGMRFFLINAYKKFKINISTRYCITDKVLWDKKTNWMFSTKYLNPKPLTEDEIEQVSNALIGFNKFCKDNNIKLYVLISPRKENIYVKQTFLKRDYMDSWGYSIDKIREKSKIPIIYPFSELIEASKKDFTFFKTDHHWTDWGAYVSYKALMKEMKKGFPNIKEVDIKDFNISYKSMPRLDFNRGYQYGQEYNRLNLQKEYKDVVLDTPYRYFTHKDYDLLKIEVVRNPELLAKFFEFPYGTNLKMLLIGTSPCENLTEVLPYSFKKTHHIRINGPKDILDCDANKIMKYYRQNILSYKPDIMVLCIQSYTIADLKDLTNEE